MLEKINLNLEKQEKIKPATIRLEFFRHDDKAASAIPSSNEEADREVPLSDHGRIHATEIGKEKNPNPEVALAYSSPRKRTTETALRQIFTDNEELNNNLSLDDINFLIDENLSLGKKCRTTELLDFNYTGSDRFRQAAAEHYGKGKDLLVWYLEESDNLVISENDQICTSYSRLAGNVAQLVKKYLQAYSRWKDIVAENKDKYTKFDNQLQRFMGTHQGVAEAFLMKAIEKTGGRNAVYEFINSLKSKNGFDFSEGYSLIISEDDQNKDIEKKININYGKKSFMLNESVINNIILDQEELNKHIVDFSKLQKIADETDLSLDIKKNTEELSKEKNNPKAWDKIYNEQSTAEIPWNFEKIPAWFSEIIESGWIQSGKTLDVGCGLGNYSNYLAENGFDVLGVDFSKEAITKDKEKFKKDNLRFEECDALNLKSILDSENPEMFDFVIDISLLHHIKPEDRKKYAESVAGVSRTGTKVLVSCFSESDPVFEGQKAFHNPDTDTVTYVLSREDIINTFQDQFEIEELDEVEFGKFSKIGNSMTRKRHLVKLIKK